MIELQQMIDSQQWEQRSEAKAALKAEVEALLSESILPSKKPSPDWILAAKCAIIGAIFGAVITAMAWDLIAHI